MCAAAHSQTFSVDLSDVRGTGLGQGRILIENIRLRQSTPNPAAPGTNTALETTYNVTFRLDPATLQLVADGLTPTGGSNDCAAASVSVFDAVRGQNAPLAGVLVTVGRQIRATDALGVASFTQLPPGPVSVYVSVGGYMPAVRTVQLACTAPTAVAMSLSPTVAGSGAIAAGQFRVILNWGENPSDLDSHLTGPGTGADRWHVYYSDQSSGGVCALDVDDVSSFGPETVTCPATRASAGTVPLRPGVYRYSVHHYSGTSHIGNSGANVRLELGNGAVYTYTPPAVAWRGEDDVWTVFELTVNTDGSLSVAPVNTLGSSGSSSVRGLPGTGPAPQFGRAEDPALMRQRSK
ncbi:MAG: hypothetical protein CFE44_01510 [Burkholderiales bacterium PBB4]|nr:MAG: hypothetical protein CFE44_01510 [Burkholderiales bacterium PBB4]